MLETAQTIDHLRSAIQRARTRGKTIGFVPTMGNLHEGHMALIDEARRHADFVVSSIFVNPMQFGANEDLDNYPRTLEADKEKLQAAGTDLLFTPTPEMIYPEGLENHTRVVVPHLTTHHCGASRPGHFDGVSTVVTILFNLVQPDLAVFGEKDYQQLAVIRKMTKDLHLPIRIIGHPTVREDDGLAKSSRNGYLTSEERLAAPALYQIMTEIADLVAAGNTNFPELEMLAKEKLIAAGFHPDYFNFAHSETLAPATPDDRHITILVAARLGNTRLIDNISVTR